MAVRAALPWYWRAALGVVLAALVLTLARFTYDFGRRFAGFDRGEAESEVTRLADLTARQQQELAELRRQLTAAERQLQIERATFDDINKQVKSLSDENAGLKEDLAFFQTLMPAGGREGGLTINRFEVVRDILPGEYRYRLLIMQTGQRAKDFQGNLQFVINLQQDSKQPAVMTLPPDGQSGRKAFQLNFRFYQRVEGSFKVAPDAVVKGMQARVFEGGGSEPKLVQSATIS